MCVCGQVAFVCLKVLYHTRSKFNFFSFPIIGAAHGYAGIYYLLFKNRQYCSSEQLNDLITSSLRFVQTQLLSTGNMTSKLNGDSFSFLIMTH